MSPTLERYRVPPGEEQTGPPGKPAPADPPLARGTPVGEFIIGCKIGEGAMASVYSAIHPLIDKRAAIKVMSRQLCRDELWYERFLQEARAVNRIRHANVVDVFGFGRLDDGRCYLIMDLLEGETLGDRLRRGALGLDDAVAILDQASEGLEATHDQGIVHRDLKPENVFLLAGRGAGPLVKLLDFGIAKLLEGGVDPSLTYSGHYVGTPNYNSPEQARGEAVTHLTDVYSLGVMAFEMFTGQLPFQAQSVAEVQSMHIGSPPPSARAIASDLPPALDLLLAKMLAKSSSTRPELPEVRAALAALRSCRVLPSEAPPATTSAPEPRQAEAKRWRRWWFTAPLLGVAIAAALLASFGDGRTTTASQRHAVARIELPDAGPPPPPVKPMLAPATTATAAAPGRRALKALERARLAARPRAPWPRIVAGGDDYVLDASGRPR
jgi:eukaryotic-like serine/threonine-protein kinase